MTFTDLLVSFGDIIASGLQIGWPLLVIAFGLSGAAYFGGKDRAKALGAWIVAAVGLFLFLLNLKRLMG